MKKYYMHTIDGHPAMFRGGQICFLNNRSRYVLRHSLEVIKDDLKHTVEWRKKQGFKTDPSRFGYVMFYQ